MNKALIIGLDSATFDVMTPLINAGRLPNLAGLMDSGVSGTLLSTIQPVTPPAWVSFMTGKNPGRHGVFDFFGPPSKGYSRPLFNSACIKARTIWEILSDHGAKVGVVNLPMTDPPLHVNGFMVPGMQYSLGGEGIRTHPPGLIHEINQQVGDYRVVYGDLESLYTNRLDNLIHQWQEIVEIRRRTICHLMDTKPWDVFMGVFYAIDVVQHHFWKMHDRSHPAYDPALASTYGDIISDVYQAVDTAIGDILARVDEDTPVMVVSDHGAGPEKQAFYLNTWLHNQGFLKYKSYLEPFRRLKLPHLFYMVLNRLGIPLVEWALNRRQLRSLGKAVDPRDALNIPLFVDWSDTVAFAGNHTEMGIYINLKGREPAGIVTKGQEYEQLRDQIIVGLQSLVLPVDGKFVKIEVFKKEDVYHGPHLQDAPDIMFIMENGSFIAQKEIHHRNIFGPAAKTSGTHRREGIFIASGKGIRSNTEIHRAHIMDMAPTLLYLLGQPVPDDMDGQVLTEMFTDDHLKTHEIRYAAAPASQDRDEAEGLDEKEKHMMKQTLRNLGYM